jgi:hypothetical protein
VLPWRTVRESVQVLRILARHVLRKAPAQGRFRVVPLAPPEDPSEQAAKRALVTAAESFAPNG